MGGSFEEWRAALDVPYEKLVSAEGVLPLYVDGPAPVVRPGSGSFGVCMRSDAAQVDEELDGGADALWIDPSDEAAMARAAARTPVVVLSGVPRPSRLSEQERQAFHAGLDTSRVRATWSGVDMIDWTVRGASPEGGLAHGLAVLLPMVATIESSASFRALGVSSLGFHEAGADATDELALMLASLAAYLRVLDASGVASDWIARNLWLQIAVGRDTFGELCKLRALRVVIAKLLTAIGVEAAPPVHAVCSARTHSQRDPWVNMLRVSTEVFAAALGGADLITPLPFDGSPHARRVARNTALVLREESHLGRVIDPAGGSYYIETRTDALAREAWSRFQQVERDGGIVKLIASGALRERLAASWASRAALIAKRKEPVLGVSEFANLDDATTVPLALTGHRDAEAFEALRARVEAAPAKRVVLVTLGEPKELRARVGFAASLFATAGLRTTEATLPETIAQSPDIACLCGSDERYATDAIATAAALRATGAIKIVLAGRPGPLEAELRAAGVTAFIYLGCDVLATLTELA